MGRDIDIVGAGLSGLVAGIHLARQGFRVVIHEARDNIGGSMRYADSTLMSRTSLRASLGIDFDEVLEPWPTTRVWAYGRKYEFDNPRNVEAFTVERGCGEASLDNLLYREAVAAGVEVRFGERLSKEEVKALPARTIVATGHDRETAEALDIPTRPFFAYMGTGEGQPGLPNVIVYFDEGTREYGYYFQSRGSAGALIFNLTRPLTDSQRRAFKEKLAVNDGVELTDWNDAIARTYAWPIAAWRNMRLESGGKILAGTLAGVIQPILLFGVNGALFSGKIAAMSVTDMAAAAAEFKRLTPLYWPQFGLRKMREYLPHPLLKPVIQAIMATYSPDAFPYLMLFALWPPGLRR